MSWIGAVHKRGASHKAPFCVLAVPHLPRLTSNDVINHASFECCDWTAYSRVGFQIKFAGRCYFDGVRKAERLLLG